MPRARVPDFNAFESIQPTSTTSVSAVAGLLNLGSEVGRGKNEIAARGADFLKMDQNLFQKRRLRGFSLVHFLIKNALTPFAPRRTVPKFHTK
jgi:hypothetical protein